MVNRTGGCQQKLLLRSDHQYRKDVQIVFENETFINNHRLPRNGEYLCRQLVPHLLLHPRAICQLNTESTTIRQLNTGTTFD